MSFKPKFTTTHIITNALTKIERARGFLDAAKLSEDWIRTMQHEAFVHEAHATEPRELRFAARYRSIKVVVDISGLPILLSY